MASKPAQRQTPNPKLETRNPPGVEVIILAGGLSTRMGRDKARLRWRGRSLLAWVRAAARATGWPVRVIRRDLVPRCGPLGGMWTAFQRTRTGRLVFLSCDMPCVTPELIRAVAARKGRAVFVHTDEGAGFPFALERTVLPEIELALAEKRFSLQALVQRLRAAQLRLLKNRLPELLNLNTPEDFECANTLARSRSAE